MSSINRIRFFIKKRYFLLFSVFSVIAFTLTLILVGLFIEPIYIFYLVVVSLFFSVLISQVIYETRANIIELNINTAILLFMVIYILLSFWYAATKAYPEYKIIMEFRKKRTDLIYNVEKNAPPPESHLAYRRQLAELYLHADPSVDRLEPNVNHWGVNLMKVFLEEQIKKGNGGKFKENMYDLAEVAFSVTSRELAHEWYEKAQEYGVSNSLKRYQERVEEYNKNSNE